MAAKTEESTRFLRRGYSKAGGLTLSETARRLGLSRARVWQIEQRALAKLRRRLEGLEL